MKKNETTKIKKKKLKTNNCFFPIFIGSDARFLIKTSARARNESSEGRETCTSKEKRRRRNAEFEERRTKEKKKKKETTNA